MPFRQSRAERYRAPNLGNSPRLGIILRLVLDLPMNPGMSFRKKLGQCSRDCPDTALILAAPAHRTRIPPEWQRGIDASTGAV